jgi:hypothetical protein
MHLEVGIASPPHRESLVAELLYEGPTTTFIPIEIYRVGATTMISFYPLHPEQDNTPQDFVLVDLLDAVHRGLGRLGWDLSGESAAAPPSAGIND